MNTETLYMYVMEEVDKEMMQGINDSILDVADAAGDMAIKVGYKDGKNFTTKAYIAFEEEERYFRFTLIFRGYPFQMKRKQVDEVTFEDYNKGINKEKADVKPNKVTGWLR